MTSLENLPTPLVSVIIPVYNTEEYVYNTIESIRNQTLKNIEIIIINDGSTDNSLEIINGCSKNDERIKVYSQKNAGQSAARNVGIKIAKGKYLYFMDSDDFLEKDALLDCYKICEENELDFVTFDADILIDKKNSYHPNITYNRSNTLDKDKIYSGVEAFDLQLKKNTYTPSPCLYLLKKNFVLNNNFCFYEGIIHEDQLFTARIYLSAKRVIYISNLYFKRRFRNNSTMTNTFSWKNIHSYLFITKILDSYKSDYSNNEQQCITLLLSQMLNAAIYNSYVLQFKQRFRLCFITMQPPYNKYIKVRTRLILLFKKYLKKHI